MEPNITSSLVSDSDPFETKALEISLPEVIEPDFPESEITQTEVIQFEVPYPSIRITSGPSHSLPLSYTQPQTIYLGPDGEPLPPGLVSIKEIPQEEPQPSYSIRARDHVCQSHPFPSPHTPFQPPLSNYFPFNTPFIFHLKLSLGLTMYGFPTCIFYHGRDNPRYNLIYVFNDTRGTF